MPDSTPDWAKDCVGYICYVDSFASSMPQYGSKMKDYTGEVYGEKMVNLRWHEQDTTRDHSSGFYGGDLQGIANVVPYLKNLGIDMVYLSPIFKALSNHKYDTLDHMQIDPQFGDEESFKRMLNRCHDSGIKVVLDGVFNHTSSEHEWHKKAMAGDKEHKSMYLVNKEGYIMVWNGIKTLPVLDYKNEKVRKYFYEADDSVVRHWLKKGVDGWRLDVAERLPKEALAGIRQAVKAEGAGKLVVGEVVETYGKEWLAEGLLDGVMNYVFRGVTANFLTKKIDGVEYARELQKMYDEYPREKLNTSWNIISTHDTNRMLFEVNNDEGMLKLAAILQFTYPGVPVIYYGDELGTLSGEKEKSNRKGHDWEIVKSYERYKDTGVMEWEKINRFNSFHGFYKHLIWVRKSSPVFSGGEYFTAHSGPDTIAYFRKKEHMSAFVIVNRGLDAQVKLTVPDEILKMNPTMRCVYGGNMPFRPTGKEMDFYIPGKNAMMFVAG